MWYLAHSFLHKDNTKHCSIKIQITVNQWCFSIKGLTDRKVWRTDSGESISKSSLLVVILCAWTVSLCACIFGIMKIQYWQIPYHIVPPVSLWCYEGIEIYLLFLFFNFNMAHVVQCTLVLWPILPEHTGIMANYEHEKNYNAKLSNKIYSLHVLARSTQF